MASESVNRCQAIHADGYRCGNNAGHAGPHGASMGREFVVWGPGAMTPDVAITLATLNLHALFAEERDREAEHTKRDELLLALLDDLAPDIAELCREREDARLYYYA